MFRISSLNLFSSSSSLLPGPKKAYYITDAFLLYKDIFCWTSLISFLNDHEKKTTKQQLGLPCSSKGKESACRRPGFDPWVGKIPWRREWQPTPVLLPGESHGQRSLIGCSPWGRRESDTTERLPFPSLHLSYVDGCLLYTD